jgi:hypothetical protein
MKSLSTAEAVSKEADSKTNQVPDSQPGVTGRIFRDGRSFLTGRNGPAPFGWNYARGHNESSLMNSQLG